MTDKPEALRLADETAVLVKRLRRTPMPLADVIPHVQQMNDCIARQHEAIKALEAERDALRADAERWRKWLPWMRNINRKPFNLAREIDAIDAARNAQLPEV